MKICVTRQRNKKERKGKADRQKKKKRNSASDIERKTVERKKVRENISKQEKRIIIKFQFSPVSRNVREDRCALLCVKDVRAPLTTLSFLLSTPRCEMCNELCPLAYIPSRSPVTHAGGRSDSCFPVTLQVPELPPYPFSPC